jgi:hypothetical protein
MPGDDDESPTELFWLLPAYSIAYPVFTQQYDERFFQKALHAFKSLGTTPTNRVWMHQLSDYVLYGGVHLGLITLSSATKIPVPNASSATVYKYQLTHPTTNAHLPFFVAPSKLNAIQTETSRQLLLEMYAVLNQRHYRRLQVRTLSHSCGVLMGRMLCSTVCTAAHCGGARSHMAGMLARVKATVNATVKATSRQKYTTTAMQHLFHPSDPTVAWEWSVVKPEPSWFEMLAHQSIAYHAVGQALPIGIASLLGPGMVKQMLSFYPGMWASLAVMSAAQRVLTPSSPTASPPHQRDPEFRIFSKRGLRKHELTVGDGGTTTTTTTAAPHPIRFLFDQFSNGWAPLHPQTPVQYAVLHSHLAEPMAAWEALWPWHSSRRSTSPTPTPTTSPSRPHAVAWIAFEADHELRYTEDGAPRSVAAVLKLYVHPPTTTDTASTATPKTTPYIPLSDRIACTVLSETAGLRHVDEFMHDMYMAATHPNVVPSVDLLHETCLITYFYKQKKGSGTSPDDPFVVSAEKKSAIVCYHLRRVWSRFKQSVLAYAPLTRETLLAKELQTLPLFDLVGHIFVMNRFQLLSDTTVHAMCEPRVFISNASFESFFYRDVPTFAPATLQNGISPLYNVMKYQLCDIFRVQHSNKPDSTRTRQTCSTNDHLDLKNATVPAQQRLFHAYQLTHTYLSLRSYMCKPTPPPTPSPQFSTPQTKKILTQMTKDTQKSEKMLKQHVIESIPKAMHEFDSVQNNVDIQHLVSSLQHPRTTVSPSRRMSPHAADTTFQGIVDAASDLPYRYEPSMHAPAPAWSPRLSTRRKSNFIDRRFMY